MEHITAEKLYSRLLEDYKIKEREGQITFKLGDVGIIVRQRDVVGNDKISDASKKQYGITLQIPRWMDIESKYRL